MDDIIYLMDFLSFNWGSEVKICLSKLPGTLKAQ